MARGFFSKIFGRRFDLDAIKAEMGRIERELRDNFDADAFRNGDWFLENFRKFAQRYYDGEHLRELEREHPELSESQLIDRLIEETVRKSTVAGGAAGAATSAASFAGFLSGGLGFTVGIGAALAELVYLVNLQLQLVFDIATLNGITVSVEEPEEIIVIFASAGGGKRLDVHLDGNLTEVAKLGGAAIRYQAVKMATSQLGRLLVKQLATKYAVPIVSVGMGAYFNYTFTSKVGDVSRTRFERVRKMKEALFTLQPRLGTDTKDALMAALVYFQSDGLMTLEEFYLLREFARSIQATDLWEKLLDQGQDVEVEDFLVRFRDPANSERREVLLEVIRIASEAKMIQSQRENQFLTKLIAP